MAKVSPRFPSPPLEEAEFTNIIGKKLCRLQRPVMLVDDGKTDPSFILCRVTNVCCDFVGSYTSRNFRKRPID